MGMLDVSISGNTAIISGLDKLSHEVLLRANEKIEKATMSTYDGSQQDVPVLSGDLRDSGEFDISHPGQGTVSYGNDEVDYALFVILGHHTRSGSFVPANDFLTPSFYRACDELKADLTGLI